MACSAKLEPAGVNADCFTPEFKRLKGRKPSPNFDSVIDLHCATDTAILNQHFQESTVHLLNKTDLNDISICGLKQVKDWRVFEFPKFPGFFVILNPFIDGYQRYWVSRCLRDFPLDKSNVTNMTGQSDLDQHDVWQRYLEKNTFEKGDPLKRLRWTTLGYHYDWNLKEYSEKNKAEFPTDVHLLSQYLSKALGFGDYCAEAAIVNFYHLDSTLAGHTDHSEKDFRAPLFSISFGQTAIFLLGGQTKSIEPLALYLRSGDICVMSGPSRLAFHAIPRILQPWSAEEAQKLKDAFDYKRRPSTVSPEQLCRMQAVSSSTETRENDSTSLHKSVVEETNYQIEKTLECLDFTPFDLTFQHQESI
ncbi:hypothetical protein EGW08_006176 [Elysia chlorotica]|uniref:Alpha-ketoglutarate-dependent dioxygenase AlkB-like domain-containing protein n=1 Tax=Elysia chlorotica TaxID=188477 RepID=A0A3S1HTY3_ELYCH|nr:hypothetical protein EGW08_006176 [Elysia chlorotica]